VGQAPRKIAVQAGAIPAQEAGLDASGQQASSQGAAADHGTLVVAGKTEVEIEADDYYFAPTTLLGTPGQHLQLTIENESGTLHNFSLPEQRLDVDVPPKGKKTVEVVFPASGSVRFFCKIHDALGMHGGLHLASPSQGADKRGQ
jgi:plastocyanin